MLGRVDTQGKFAQRLNYIHTGLHGSGCLCPLSYEGVKPDVGVYTARKIAEDAWESGVLDLSDYEQPEQGAKVKSCKGKKGKQSTNLKCKGSSKKH